MLEGEIREIDLVARLVDLWREKFTGAIRFESDGIIKIIYFKGGDILSASTNDRADSVDEILMRANKVSREHVKQALAKRKENETLGDTLLNLGFITRKELTWARRIQVVNVIRSITEWEAGSFTIVADYLPKRDEGTNFPLPQIIVEMVVTDQDRQKFEKLLESGSAVFGKAPGFPEAFAKLGLNEEADAIVSEVDGTRSATEVAAASGQETFNAYKLLHALSLLGLLTRIRAAVPASEALSFEGAGVSDAADAWTGELPKFDLADEPGQETATLRAPAPPPLPPLPPLKEEEPAWGFDDAQIEAAQQASVPEPRKSAPALAAAIPSAVVTPEPRRSTERAKPTPSGTMTTRRVIAPPPQKKSHFGLLVALMTVFIIAGIAYFAFMWWNARSAEAAPIPPVKHAATKKSAPATAPVVTQTAPTTTVPPVPAAIAQHTPAPPPPTPVTTQAVAKPPANARSDADRYAAMARNFAASPRGKFTVQFEIVCDPSNITKALRSGGDNVWFVPISLKGRSCYRVFWGRYETRDAAERGVSEIPASLREAKPAVVSVPQS